MFGKPAQKGKKSSKAKSKTKDEDLFKDDTDIFADVPAAKPKEKKKKKTSEKKSLFKDDDGECKGSKNFTPLNCAFIKICGFSGKAVTNYRLSFE